jgi:hypothetical protein
MAEEEEAPLEAAARSRLEKLVRSNGGEGGGAFVSKPPLPQRQCCLNGSAVSTAGVGTALERHAFRERATALERL